MMVGGVRTRAVPGATSAMMASLWSGGEVCRVALLVTIIALLAAVAPPRSRAGAATACAEMPAAGTTDEPSPAADPETVVCQTVVANGAVYAGDCAATRSPEDVGKVCSRFVAQRGSLRAYLTGRTFSEFSLWVFVERTRAGWLPAGSAPLDFAAPDLEIPWPLRSLPREALSEPQ